MINSQNGKVVKIGRFNNKQFIQQAEQVYPGGVTEYDINGKILIEFTHYDGYGGLNAEFSNSSILAM